VDTEVDENNIDERPEGVFVDGYTIHVVTLAAEDMQYPALLLDFTNSNDEELNTTIVFGSTVPHMMLFRTHINQAIDAAILNAQANNNEI